MGRQKSICGPFTKSSRKKSSSQINYFHLKFTNSSFSFALFLFKLKANGEEER